MMVKERVISIILLSKQRPEFLDEIGVSIDFKKKETEKETESYEEKTK